MEHSIEAIQRMQASAWKQYKKAKPSAKKKREAFLEKLAQSYEVKENEKLANKVREINKAEALREAQQEVQQAIQPRGISNILHIEVQDPESPNKIKEIHDQREIKETMKTNFKGKFIEVYDTPLQHEPFLLWFNHN